MSIILTLAAVALAPLVALAVISTLVLTFGRPAVTLIGGESR